MFLLRLPEYVGKKIRQHPYKVDVTNDSIEICTTHGQCVYAANVRVEKLPGVVEVHEHDTNDNDSTVNRGRVTQMLVDTSLPRSENDWRPWSPLCGRVDKQRVANAVAVLRLYKSPSDIDYCNDFRLDQVVSTTVHEEPLSPRAVVCDTIPDPQSVVTKPTMQEVSETPKQDASQTPKQDASDSLMREIETLTTLVQNETQALRRRKYQRDLEAAIARLNK